MFKFDKKSYIEDILVTYLNKIIISLLFLLAPIVIKAQDDYIKGFVMEEKTNGSLSPIPFANIYWADTIIGTTSDSLGFLIYHTTTLKTD